jgi:hypothetical protein
MKNAMATSHGNNRLLDVSNNAGVVGTGKAKSNYLAWSPFACRFQLKILMRT